MKRAHGFWLLALLTGACAVKGFTIVDELPGAGAAPGGGHAGTSPAASGSPAQGGNGTSGAANQGGKVGAAGSSNSGGMPGDDGGEPATDQGGDGAGGEGSEVVQVLPCDQESDGQPPLLCDDFESGALSAELWAPAAGTAMVTTSQQGPHDASKVVHLTGQPLPTTVGDFNLQLGQVTVSFWVKFIDNGQELPIISFRNTGTTASRLNLVPHLKEPAWNSIAMVWVPETPTGAVMPADVWTCMSIHLTQNSIVLRYQSRDFDPVYTLVADDVPTPGIDTNWQNQPVDARLVGGDPEFGGQRNGIGAELYLDDVRIARDNSSVCPF